MIEMFIIFKHLLKFRVMKKLGLFLLYAGISYTAALRKPFIPFLPNSGRWLSGPFKMPTWPSSNGLPMAPVSKLLAQIGEINKVAGLK
jgi:hypothetical protein